MYAIVFLVIGLLGFRYCVDRRLNTGIGKNFLPLMAITQLAAFVSPTVLIYNSIVAIAMVVGCQKRDQIAPTYLFLLVTLPLPSKVISTGSTYLMAYDASISLALGGMAALMMHPGGRPQRSVANDVPIYAFLLLLAFINARSTTATNLLRVLLDLTSTILLPYLLVSRAVRSAQDFRFAIYGLVAGMAALSTLAIYEALHMWPLYRIVADHYGIYLGGDANVKVRAGLLRSPGPFTEPTSFGYCLAIGMIAAILSRNLFRSSTLYLGFLGVLCLGILAPQSRGAWLGVIVGIVGREIYDGRWASLSKKVAIGAIAGLAIVTAGKLDSRIASTAGLNAEGQGTVEYRSNLLTRGLEEIRAHPVIGRPPDVVRAALRDMTQGEGIVDFVNTYLFIGLTSGVIGFVIFVLIFLTPCGALLKARSTPFLRLAFRRGQDPTAGLVFGTLLGIMSMIAVTSMTGRTTIFVAIEIGFASAILNFVYSRQAMPRQRAAATVDTQASAAMPVPGA
ncbi:hypothetical protein GCM10011380_28280 [Sphingomonas metalli]|uniref:O-antigen ligase-related domain-containing protein n=1 Tax=Sphingomonas metalli TaxID=1779358 RepID=A0A916WXD8_9SPHN|nr:hypothetical protein GCM10011380_28280 [Sphingomonas metalli]